MNFRHSIALFGLASVRHFGFPGGCQGLSLGEGRTDTLARPAQTTLRTKARIQRPNCLSAVPLSSSLGFFDWFFQERYGGVGGTEDWVVLGCRQEWAWLNAWSGFGNQGCLAH